MGAIIKNVCVRKPAGKEADFNVLAHKLHWRVELRVLHGQGGIVSHFSANTVHKTLVKPLIGLRNTDASFGGEKPIHGRVPGGRVHGQVMLAQQGEDESALRQASGISL